MDGGFWCVGEGVTMVSVSLQSSLEKSGLLKHSFRAL